MRNLVPLVLVLVLRFLPRLLSTMDDLHPTRKGIFAMDSHGTRVATGSKDTTVAITSLRPTGIEQDRCVCVCMHV